MMADRVISSSRAGFVRDTGFAYSLIHAIMKWLSVLMLGLGSMHSACAQWVSSQRLGNTAYFLFSYPARMERYDLENRVWMPSITIPTNYGLPVCGCVDADGIFLAQGNTVCRYDLNGGNQTHLGNFTEKVSDLLTDGNLLFVNRSTYGYARFTSINKSTNTVIASFENYLDAVYGASIAPSIDKIFGRSRDFSPEDITFVSYNASGQILSGGDSPHHGDFPSAVKTWVFPDDSKVVDSSGTIYSASTLTYAGSLGTSIVDVQFLGNNAPVVVQGSLLTSYGSNLLPQGSAALPFVTRNIYPNGADVIAFGYDKTLPNGIRTHIEPLANLGAPEPGTPVEPRGLAYTPDNLFMDKNGVLLLFSKEHKSIFRWDTGSQAYLDTIPLIDTPDHAAYSVANHTIYLAYPSGIIRQIDLAAEPWSEQSFAVLPTAPLGLATAGSYVFAADSSGAWCTHRTFDPLGVQVDAEDWNYFSSEYIWNTASQKMYFFRDDTSPNDLFWEEINESGTAYPGEPAGGIGSKDETPLHDSAPFKHPIRVSPDGSVVVLGSGAIFDGNSLERLPVALANTVRDVLWTGPDILTCRTTAGSVQYQRWSGPTLAPTVVKQHPGSALRIFSLGANRVLGVSMSGGTPSFDVMDADFQTIPPSSLEAPGGLTVSTPSSGRLLLKWGDVTGESEYLVERKTHGSSAWSELGRTAGNINRLEFGTLTADDTFDYRVTAANGALASAPSAPLENVVSGPPIAPPSLSARPYQGESGQAVSLTWSDVALETGYRLEIRVGGGNWRILTHLPQGTTSYAAEGLQAETKHQFRIRSQNELGHSPWAVIGTITLEGRGEISIEQPHGPPLVDGRSVKKFGKAAYGADPKIRLLAIVNRGSAKLSDLRITITGPAAGDFEVSPLPRTTLPGGWAMVFGVKFQPKNLGTRHAVLHIHSDDPDEKSFDIRLTGEGTLQ